MALRISPLNIKIEPLEAHNQRKTWIIMNLGGVSVANYRRSKNSAERAYRHAGEDDKKIIGSMISECEYVMEWLETGRRPGNKRGVERHYERPWDPQWLNQYKSPNGWEVQRESRDLTEHERFRIEESMRDLSDREKQCFMLHVVDGMSYAEISQELHIGRSTVQTNVERAREKIEYAKLTSLFLAE